VSDDDFLRVEENGCPMSSCAAPAGSPCRTGRGRVAAQYHTARFRLVPHLAKALSVPVPPLRRPGSAWTELPRPTAPDAAPTGHARVGYARASTIRQSLDTQVDSLRAAGVTRIFAEKISTRALTRPELDKAVALASEMRPSGVAVTIVVHEHKRLGRGIELAALAEQLRAAGIGLEFLTGELHGSHDPSGVVFTVLAALSGTEGNVPSQRTVTSWSAKPAFMWSPRRRSTRSRSSSSRKNTRSRSARDGGPAYRPYAAASSSVRNSTGIDRTVGRTRPFSPAATKPLQDHATTGRPTSERRRAVTRPDSARYRPWPFHCGPTPDHHSAPPASERQARR
jgi:DNA invertase Pin-like site-specific DNA recombinase